MPVKILGFEVQRKRIRKKQLQRLRNVMNRSFRKSRGSREWGFVQHIIYLVDRWLDAVCDRQPTAKIMMASGSVSYRSSSVAGSSIKMRFSLSRKVVVLWGFRLTDHVSLKLVALERVALRFDLLN
jgi:hypothetical protein